MSRSLDPADAIGLDFVMQAAERGLSPLGCELAGFLVLQTLLRVHELGGGAVTTTAVVLSPGGNVGLAAAPARCDEAVAAGALRAMLGELLAICTSTTPALRACARRRGGTLAGLCDELEAALVPLNREASQRGLARIARTAIEARAAGRLRKRKAAPRAPLAGAAVSSDAKPREQPMVHAEPEVAAQLAADEDAVPTPALPTPMPRVAIAVAKTAPPPLPDPFTAIALGDDGPAEFEVVSQLPPLVSPIEGAAHDLAPDASGAPATELVGDDATVDDRGVAIAQRKTGDRVASLSDAFSISDRKDDQALARALRHMVDVRSALPPSVGPVGTSRARVDGHDDELRVDVDSPPPTALFTESPVAIGADADDADETTGPQSSRSTRRRVRLWLALGAAAMLGAVGFTRHAELESKARAWWAASASDGAARPVAASSSPSVNVAGAAPKAIALPTTCEASLTVGGLSADVEVYRRIAITPAAVAMPTGVALDLLVTADGMNTRRARIDANAPWVAESTGNHLSLELALEATKSGNRAGSPARPPTFAPLAGFGRSGARGMVSLKTTLAGAAVWLAVDPHDIGGLPCGAPVDLQLISGPDAPTRSLRVEWSTFVGSPPRATIKG
jgi:hypothetical protein